MLADIEAALIAKIKALAPAVLVEGFPDQPAGYRLSHPVGAVLVRFAGGEYGQSRATDVVVQNWRLVWELTVVVRNLRRHDGAYPLLDALRRGLTGAVFPGCGKAYPVRDEFVDETGGIWQYALALAMPAMNVETGTADTEPLLTRITTSDNFGTTEEIP